MPAKKIKRKGQLEQKASSVATTATALHEGEGDTLLDRPVPLLQMPSARGNGRGKRQCKDTATEDNLVQEPDQQKTPDANDTTITIDTAIPIVVKRAKSVPVNMTKEQEDDFSEWLQKNTHHYDMSDVNFRMKERKIREMEAKAVEYGITYTQLVTRFKTIRDVVLKERRKGKSGDGAKEVSKRTQRLINLFGFLAEYCHTRPGRDTLKVTHTAAQREEHADLSETDEEDGPPPNDTSPEVASKGPKPRRIWKKTPPPGEQQKQIIDALQKAMAQNTAIQAQAQLCYDGAPTMDRERRMFGEWFTSALPRVDDSLWVEFRAKISTTIDTYHEWSMRLRKVGDQKQTQAQSGYQYPYIASTFAPTFQSQQSPLMIHQEGQQPARTYSQQQSLTSKSCPDLPDWMRKFQTQEQDRIFPEHQSVFSQQQLSQLQPPVRTTQTMIPLYSAGASVLSGCPPSKPSATHAQGTTSTDSGSSPSLQSGHSLNQLVDTTDMEIEDV